MSIGERIHRERLLRRLSQEELAEALGVSAKSIRRWEKGLVTPQAHYQLQLGRFFNLAAEFFFEEHEEKQKDSPQSGLVPLWTVPYPRNLHFTGRDDLLGLLVQHLSPAGLRDSTIPLRAVLTQPQAIKGLGGIGKTQIVVEYAYRAREQGRYTHILWINAASEEAIMTSLVNLAELLPDFSAKEEKDQLKLVSAIKRWLEQCPQNWLLIFDNADDLPLVQGYFPHQGHGSLLLTTRANAVGSLASSIEVEQMGVIEGTRFLLHRAQRLEAGDEESNEATNVVIALDGFPLALDQAGAYIEETGCSFRDYLQLYQDHRKVLLARRGIQVTNYPDSVATTWLLSFQKVEQANPATAELLRLCAFLSPDHIPEELFSDGAAHWPPTLQQATTEHIAFNQVLEELLSFSLVKRRVEDHTLSIHRLVQAVQREMMEAEEQRQWAECVVRAVNTVFPVQPRKEVSSWSQCLRYLEQVQACDVLIEQQQLVLPEAADLLNRAGSYLQEHASYTLAQSLYERALSISEQALGPEHPLVAHPLNNLALLSYDQGKYNEAEAFYERALSIREQALGSEHLLVAYSLNNLAMLYKEQGKYSEAEALYERALSICEQQLGREHPEVAFPLNNLGLLLVELGRYSEAEAFYERALSIREQALGPEHPLVAYPLDNLGQLYYEQGRYSEAEPLSQRAISIWEQQLGPEHPLVAYPLTNLANLYRAQSKYEEAEPFYQQALTIREQALDPNHPEVAETLHGFAQLREAQGNIQEATLLYQRTLAIREQVLGTYHPKTTETRECLRAVLIALGQTETAM